MNELAASTLPFLQTLADARIPAVTSIMNVITVMGDEKLFVVISMIIAWCVSKRGGQYMLTVGFGLSNVGQTLKMIFRVPRPWNLGETPFENADPTARGSGITGMEGKGSGIAKLLGSGADGCFPLAICRSLPQIALARMRTSTSSSPSCEISRSIKRVLNGS